MREVGIIRDHHPVLRVGPWGCPIFPAVLLNLEDLWGNHFQIPEIVHCDRHALDTLFQHHAGALIHSERLSGRQKQLCHEYLLIDLRLPRFGVGSGDLVVFGYHLFEKLAFLRR